MNLFKLPDLAKTFQKLKISLDLTQKVNDKSLIGMAILIGLQEKKFDEVLDMIYEQSCCNRPAMEDIVGVDLLLEIEDYLSEKVGPIA